MDFKGKQIKLLQQKLKSFMLRRNMQERAEYQFKKLDKNFCSPQ
jgi:hypothetical protein